MRAERQVKATRLSGAFRVQTIMLARYVRLEFTTRFLFTRRIGPFGSIRLRRGD